MSADGGKKLPDRKRIDQRSDLTAVESQHDQNEEIVKKHSSHVRLLSHGGPAGQLAWWWTRITYMKYCMLFLWLFLASSVQAQVMPTTLAGIVLGADIATIHEICRMDTAIPLVQERHLKEMQLLPQFVPGIKSGTVAYANCAQIGRIVRIKLKFDNNSRIFFDSMLKRYKERFGEPKEWRGDPFQTVMSWKWSFADSTGQRVNLELTHSKDEDYKTGNFVKMTLRSLWEEEAACLKKKWGQSAEDLDSPTPPHKLDYMLLIPK